jgi:hypothetical protein
MGQRLPALTTIEGKSISTSAKWSQAKARIGAVFVSPSHDQVAAPHDHAQATCRVARFQQSRQGRYHRRQPRNVWTSASRGMLASVPIAGWRCNQPRRGTTGPTARPGRVQARRLSCMARCIAMIVLTAVQEQQLTAWARAAKTPQRLARRARVILGSAAGLGSRRLARQERMSRTTVQRWRASVHSRRL